MKKEDSILGDFFRVVFSLSVVGLLIALFFFLVSYFNLSLTKFFKPRYENVDRAVFENTKSYLHGVQQDLGKYYDEYRNAKSEDEKEVIREVIKARFAEVDPAKIQSLELRRFLIAMRGY